MTRVQPSQGQDSNPSHPTQPMTGVQTSRGCGGRVSAREGTPLNLSMGPRRCLTGCQPIASSGMGTPSRARSQGRRMTKTRSGRWSGRQACGRGHSGPKFIFRHDPPSPSWSDSREGNGKGQRFRGFAFFFGVLVALFRFRSCFCFWASRTPSGFAPKVAFKMTSKTDTLHPQIRRFFLKF